MLVAHADWGADPAKRWICVAAGEPGTGWTVSAARPFGSAIDLRAAVGAAPSDAVILGVDFPLGLPRAHAAAAGATDFRAVLSELGRGEWSQFFDVADDPSEISLHRPFFPRTPGRRGERSRTQLTDALGLAPAQLWRRCELGQPHRSAACPLFWTLGANQAGKGALAGWRLLQAEPPESLRLWPFDGSLSELVAPGRLVVAEAYPAEFLHHLDLPRTIGKRRQLNRVAVADSLESVADRLGADLAPALQTQLADGFGPGPTGEDAFDAVVGVLGTLQVVAGLRPEGVPGDDPAVTSVEGWILGQAS